MISYSKNETEWNLGGRDKRNLVIIDVYTTWTILVGIFFPSVTGEIKMIESEKTNLEDTFPPHLLLEPLPALVGTKTVL